MHVRRHRLVLVFCGVAMPLWMASAAFACTSLATIQANPSATVGVTTMAITGNGFEPASTIEIRLDGRDAPLRTVDGSSVVGSTGAFTVVVSMPSVSVGYHFFLATPTDGAGNPVAGTPARASFQVLPANASPSAVPNGPGHPHERGHPNTTRSSVLDLATLTSPLGIILLAASGVIGLVVSRPRRGRTPTMVTNDTTT